MEVGEFKSRPKCAGRYEYLPYRGPGHYEMHQALKTEKEIICTFAKRNLTPRKMNRIVQATWQITVFSCPEYGILETSSPRERKS